MHLARSSAEDQDKARSDIRLQETPPPPLRDGPTRHTPIRVIGSSTAEEGEFNSKGVGPSRVLSQYTYIVSDRHIAACMQTNSLETHTGLSPSQRHQRKNASQNLAQEVGEGGYLYPIDRRRGPRFSTADTQYHRHLATCHGGSREGGRDAICGGA